MLTADRHLDFKLNTDPIGNSVELLLAATAKIFQGAFVGINATGFAKPYDNATPATTLAGGDRIVGVAAHASDNTSGIDGDKTIKVMISGAFDHVITGLVAADVGTPIYASDDGTLTKVALGNAFVGWVERFVSAGLGTVRLQGFESGGPMIHRTSASIDCVAANEALLIHHTENQNGLIILWAGAIVTEVFAGATQDQGIVTLQDTDGTTLGTTFTAANTSADVVNDLLAAAANSVAIGAISGSLMTVVPAGKGVKAKVTQLTAGAGAAGAMKVIAIAIPIA